jgi:wobble nucleotide-excising tRNase
MNKLSSAIKKITLNSTVINGEEYAATFHGDEMIPSFVNFGFGNNGTGKSSISKAIRDDVGVEWERGKSADDYSVLVYNQDFIDEHFANYNYLPGIYTLGAKNKEIAKQINENAEQVKKHTAKVKAITDAKTVKEKEKSDLFPTFHEMYWQHGAPHRADFKLALQGKIGSKSTFASTMLTLKESPVQHDYAALKALYDLAFFSTPENPSNFSSIDMNSVRRAGKNILLDQPIVGRDDSQFGRFIKALGAADWIRRGAEQYAGRTGGKCPFCQQDLPEDFADLIANCFDNHYQEDIAALNRYRTQYIEFAKDLMTLLKGNLNGNIYSKFSPERLKVYENSVQTVRSIMRENVHIIDRKIAEPSTKVQLESIEQICNEINAIVAEYNSQVKSARAIISDLANKKRECTKKVFELLAFEMQSLNAKYVADAAKIEKEIAELSKQISEEKAKSAVLLKQNGELEKQIVTISTAVNGINTLLKDSGFQGFELRVHEGSGQSAYKVIRPHTGRTAKDLSEGERNFIAFLYFYYLVNGSKSDNDIEKDKIVVIDDPVSSMDATVLHIVSMLVRDIADSCIKGEPIKGVKQVFVLTHNVHFHTKTANYLVNRYDVASYFHLTKSDNVSKVKLCVRPDQKSAGNIENYNPVPSEYAILWKDYKTAETSLMLRNIIWQILDYYFVQMSEMDGDNLREKILVTNREKFIEKFPNGQEDKSKLVMVTKLLSYMGTGSQESAESRYIEADEDLAQHREAFKLIFTAMEQDQHYRMMMAETER